MLMSDKLQLTLTSSL